VLFRLTDYNNSGVSKHWCLAGPTREALQRQTEKIFNQDHFPKESSNGATGPIRLRQAARLSSPNVLRRHGRGSGHVNPVTVCDTDSRPDTQDHLNLFLQETNAKRSENYFVVEKDLNHCWPTLSAYRPLICTGTSFGTGSD
jgi:hypothetical protein